MNTPKVTVDNIAMLSNDDRMEHGLLPMHGPDGISDEVPTKSKSKSKLFSTMVMTSGLVLAAVVAITTSRSAFDAANKSSKSSLFASPSRKLQSNKGLLVGAYYYAWHGSNFHNGDGYVRRELDPAQQPELGEYDDTKPEVIAQES